MKIDVTEGLDKHAVRDRSTHEKPVRDQSVLQLPEDIPFNTTADNPDLLKTTVDKMNDLAEPLRTNVEFQLHEDLEEYYITVVDSTTREVLKEIPPKKMLDSYAAMAEFMGLLVDEQI